MGDPGAIVAVVGFALLVGLDLGEDLLVDGGILGRNKGRHTAHRQRSALVAGLDQQPRVGGEERLVHGHHLTIRQYPIRMVLQGFDIAEDVVPAAAVQRHYVILHLIEQLIHLEYGWQGFNQHGGLDGATGQTKLVLGPGEYFAPPAPFQMALQLGHVEVGARAFGQQRLIVVQEIEGKIEQAAGDGLAIEGDMFPAGADRAPGK